MTEAQIKALLYLSNNPVAAPSSIGQAMGGTRSGSAQGMGRLGGRMARNLIKLGLAIDASRQRGGFPAYSITSTGRAVLRDMQLL